MQRKGNSKELLEFLVKSLVKNPDEVFITELEKEGALILELKVSSADRGRVIGKNGKTIKAIRKVISAASSGSERRVVVELVE